MLGFWAWIERMMRDHALVFCNQILSCAVNVVVVGSSRESPTVEKVSTTGSAA